MHARTTLNSSRTSSLGQARQLVAAACLFASLPSLAQTVPVPGFNLERLYPDPANVNSAVVSTGDGLSSGTLRTSLFLQYERDPLVYYVNGARVGAPVSSRLTLDVGAAYGVTDWAEVGAVVPFVLRQAGDNLSSLGVAPVPHSWVDAPLVQGRFTLLRESLGSPVDVGLTLGLMIPVGPTGALNRDPSSGLAFIPRLGAGRTVGRWVRVGAEVGAVVRGEANLAPFSTFQTNTVGSMLSLAATASTLGTGLRGELDVRGLIPFTQTGRALEVLVGGRYPFLDRKLEAFALAGPGFGTMPGAPEFRVMGGLAWTPMMGEEPVRHVGQAEAGSVVCPAPAPSPAPAKPLDTDGDGTPDDQDRCPTVKGPASNAGCPVVDSDGDGIPDDKDKCPNQKGPPESDGCPPPAPKSAVALETGHISLSEKVRFSSGKAEIDQASTDLLTQVADLLKAHPELKRVRIEGHTDNAGAPARNLRLSQTRAEAVKSFLVAHGVEAARLEAKGFGSERPIAPNATPAGRELNRRVEFISEQ